MGLPETVETRSLAVFDAMRRRLQDDCASRNLGITVTDAEPGRITMRMPIAPPMRNGHGILHGGYVFLLADTCFAFVCESTGHPSVTRQADITYIAAGGNCVEYIQAEGVQRTRYGRNSIVDIAVHADSGILLAEARIFGVVVKSSQGVQETHPD